MGHRRPWRVLVASPCVQPHTPCRDRTLTVATIQHYKTTKPGVDTAPPLASGSANKHCPGKHGCDPIKNRPARAGKRLILVLWRVAVEKLYCLPLGEKRRARRCHSSLRQIAIVPAGTQIRGQRSSSSKHGMRRTSSRCPLRSDLGSIANPQFEVQLPQQSLKSSRLPTSALQRLPGGAKQFPGGSRTH